MILGVFLLVWMQGGQAPATGTLEGVVLNSVTKEPVRKADVRIQTAGGSGGRRTFGVITDASGRFSAPGLEPGEYALTATKTGFLGNPFSPQPRGNGASANVRVAAGDIVRNIELRLVPAGVLAGRVVDEDGDPVAGASIALWQARQSRSTRQSGRQMNSGTNDKGEFRIANIAAGKYLLSAEWVARGNPEPPGGVRGPEMGYATTYFPGVTDAAQAAPIEIQAGQELTGLELPLRRTPVFRVRGRVVDSEWNKPGQRSYVFLASRESNMTRQFGSMMMEEGKFEIAGVPAGTYTVVAQRMDRNEQLFAIQPIEVSGSSIDGLTLTLQPGLTLQGRMSIEGQSSVALKSLTVNLTPSDSLVFLPPPRIDVKDDGSFTMKSVFPGRYRVDYFTGGRGALYLASAKYNDADVTFAPLEIGQGAGGTLNLVFRSDGGKVSGTVRNGDSPAGGAAVLLLPVAEERRSVSNVMVIVAAADGSYQFGGIRPGDYYLIAGEGPESIAWDDPDWLKARQDKMTKVSVTANGSTNVPLTLAEDRK